MGSIFKVHDDHQNDGTLKTAVLGAHVEFTSIISTASVVTVFVVSFPSVSRELRTIYIRLSFNPGLISSCLLSGNYSGLQPVKKNLVVHIAVHLNSYVCSYIT